MAALAAGGRTLGELLGHGAGAYARLAITDLTLDSRRVTAGSAFVVTPNAPADFENPFHVYLFEAAHLTSMLSLFFEEVTCLGIEGDAVLQAIQKLAR